MSAARLTGIAPDARARLLNALNKTLSRGSVEQLSIREIARAAKVSHALPAYYFGDKRGLLTAFAVEGYRMLAREVVRCAAKVPDDDHQANLKAQGEAYVRFALRHPNHFLIMFHYGGLDESDEELSRGAAEVFNLLRDCITAHHAEKGQPERDKITLISAWAIVHGLAMILIAPKERVRIDSAQQDSIIDAVTTQFAKTYLP